MISRHPATFTLATGITISGYPEELQFRLRYFGPSRYSQFAPPIVDSYWRISRLFYLVIRVPVRIRFNWPLAVSNVQLTYRLSPFSRICSVLTNSPKGILPPQWSGNTGSNWRQLVITSGTVIHLPRPIPNSYIRPTYWRYSVLASQRSPESGPIAGYTFGRILTLELSTRAGRAERSRRTNPGRRTGRRWSCPQGQRTTGGAGDATRQKGHGEKVMILPIGENDRFGHGGRDLTGTRRSGRMSELTG